MKRMTTQLAMACLLCVACTDNKSVRFDLVPTDAGAEADAASECTAKYVAFGQQSALVKFTSQWVGWSWPIDCDGDADFSRVVWTLGLPDGSQTVLLDARTGTETEVVRERLDAMGETTMRLELYDHDGAYACGGEWTHDLKPGRLWYLLWAWDTGEYAWPGGPYDWKAIECPGHECGEDLSECCRLWVGTSIRDPLTNVCTDPSGVWLECVEDQQTSDALAFVRREIACDELLAEADVYSEVGPGTCERLELRLTEPAAGLGVLWESWKWANEGVIMDDGLVNLCSY